MDERIINAILEATVQTMAMMARMEVKSSEPIEKNDDLAVGDLSGIMTLTSPKVKISFAISFPESVMTHIAETMLPPTSQKSRGTMLDLVGEVANIISGGTKQRLCELEPSLELSLPIIIYGKGHSVIHRSKPPTYILPLNCDAGEFHMEVCYENEG